MSTGSSRSCWRRAVAALLACLPAAATAAEGFGEGLSHLSVEQNRNEFLRICRQLTEGENDYFGRRIVGELEAKLDRAEDPLVKVLLTGHLGHELMRIGELERAIDLLEASMRLIFTTPDLMEDGALQRSQTTLLATAHLLHAEDLNCLEGHTAMSCVLPIAPEAVHRRPASTRRAGDLFGELARTDPGDTVARWLLNLSRALSGDYPQGVPEALRLPALSTPIDPTPERAWTEVGWNLGVGAVDLAGGAIMDDFDGDGLLDLVSSTWDPCDSLKAFRNDGEGGFEDVTRAWGLDGQLGSLNLTHADFDADGRLDILVLRGAWLGDEGRIRNSLLRNDLGGPTGRFLDVTAAAGLDYPAYPTQNAAWADYDLDGDLDVFIGNEATGSSTNPLQLFGEEGNPYPSQLFRNNGDGTFTDVARAAGVQNFRFAKGSTWGDFDDDGDPDLYISNIGANRLYRNLGDGTFEDAAPELGVTEPANGTFPTWFFDADNDGDLDLFVGSYSTAVPDIFASFFGRSAAEGRPVLYRNEGGTFVDASDPAGFGKPLLVMGANHGDIDNDGFQDLYFGTGVPDFEALMPNVMYRNRGGGSFEDITFASGFGHLQKGHGVAFGDVDNDGDQDIFQQLGGAYPSDTYANALYRNPGGAHRWITLRLEGAGANTFGVGARLEVRLRQAGARRSVHVLAGAGGSFGASSLQQEIGLGLADEIEAVLVRWPGGDEPQRFEDVELDRVYRVIEGEERLHPVEAPPIALATTPTSHDP